MTPEQEILADGIVIVRQQNDRFSRDLMGHATVLPLDPSAEPTDDLRVNVTAFIKRFELMQDRITRKLFRSVLAVQGRSFRTNNLAEVVRAAAELGIIQDAERWRRLTELRNIFAHDYLLTFDVVARLANEAWQFCPIMIETVSLIEVYVERERLLKEVP